MARTFSVDFMRDGKRVERNYVTAHNEHMALSIAERIVTVAYDEVIVSAL